MLVLLVDLCVNDPDLVVHTQFFLGYNLRLNADVGAALTDSNSLTSIIELRQIFGAITPL